MISKINGVDHPDSQRFYDAFRSEYNDSWKALDEEVRKYFAVVPPKHREKGLSYLEDKETYLDGYFGYDKESGELIFVFLYENCGLSALREGKYGRNLRYLNLSGNQLSELNNTIYECLPRLFELKLEGNVWSEETIKKIESYNSLEKMRTLAISGNSERIIPKLEFYSRIPKLYKLTLSNVDFSNKKNYDGDHPILELNGDTRIWLVLRNCIISDNLEIKFNVRKDESQTGRDEEFISVVLTLLDCQAYQEKLKIEINPINTHEQELTGFIKNYFNHVKYHNREANITQTFRVSKLEKYSQFISFKEP